MSEIYAYKFDLTQAICATFYCIPGPSWRFNWTGYQWHLSRSADIQTLFVGHLTYFSGWCRYTQSSYILGTFDEYFYSVWQRLTPLHDIPIFYYLYLLSKAADSYNWPIKNDSYACWPYPLLTTTRCVTLFLTLMDFWIPRALLIQLLVPFIQTLKYPLYTLPKRNFASPHAWRPLAPDIAPNNWYILDLSLSCQWKSHVVHTPCTAHTPISRRPFEILHNYLQWHVFPLPEYIHNLGCTRFPSFIGHELNILLYIINT